MRLPVYAVLVLLFASVVLAMPGDARQDSVPAEENFTPSGVHPMLFLNPGRLRLLRRERERNSPRWQQFNGLVTGNARMPEPGFAFALYYQVSGDVLAARKAIEWAQGDSADLWQAALVYDWCENAMRPATAAALAKRLEQALARIPEPGVTVTRDRVLEAIAIADREPDVSARELERVVRSWWGGTVAHTLSQGRSPIRRADTYALLEILHAIRDATGIDLRESAPEYFRNMAESDLLGYYPAIYPAPENDFRMPATKGAVIDLQAAALARVADLLMVAYDTNSTANQFVQGWAMHDRFLMRGSFGAPYEFLWGNPYQPGLSYYNAPLRLYDPAFGRLYLRTRWDDGANWLAYVDGELQTFSDGEPKVLSLKPPRVAQWFGKDAAVVAGADGAFVSLVRNVRWVYIVGLEPLAQYHVDGHDRHMREQRADVGGIIALEFPDGFRGGISLKRVSSK